jgi:hypothetical protein
MLTWCLHNHDASSGCGAGIGTNQAVPSHTLHIAQVSQFESKQDLIEAVMASAHVPFFLDGRPFLRFRERLCWDGSFPDFVYFDNSNFIKRDGKVCI